MEAACRGARSRRGRTIGILPGEDREEANGWVEIAIATGLGELRNGLVVRAADAVLCIGGSWGTLSEVALAVRTGVPVVALGGWVLPRAEAPGPGIENAPDVEAAVRRVLELAGSPRQRPEICGP